MLEIFNFWLSVLIYFINASISDVHILVSKSTRTHAVIIGAFLKYASNCSVLLHACKYLRATSHEVSTNLCIPYTVSPPHVKIQITPT